VQFETMELKAALETVREKEQRVLIINEQLLRAAHALRLSDEAGGYESHEVHLERQEQRGGEFRANATTSHNPQPTTHHPHHDLSPPL
jgi:hypothetical protein